MVQHFQKISGYKVISKCRNCGARIVGRTESFYCPACLERLQKFREREDAEREAKVKKAAAKPVKRVAAKAARPAKRK